VTKPSPSRTIAAATLVALALASAGCGKSGRPSSDAHGAALPGRGKPPVRLGTKNFTEEFILGQLYAQALRAKGFTVVLKDNVGASEIIDRALTTGGIDLYPEYTGVIVGEIAHESKRPRSEAETYARAKAFEEKRGFGLLAKSPGYDRDVNVVKPAYAKRYKLKSTADLKRVGKFRFGAPPENRTRFQGIVGMRKVYGVTNAIFTPLPIGKRYQALDSGRIDVAAGFTTDGQLAEKGKYVQLSDPKGIFGFQNIVPVVNRKVLGREGPAFAQALNAVTAKLTNAALQEMNKAVDLDGRSVRAVAREFLRANGLVK
jgi:osmoprotectant transport system substrate-binding protein